ncbi:NAD(P)-dependent dehydrogenase (short-subunit alcohol dehydrogenase family) [Agromyces flavus]|uniref:NAD(P)-dependent dehydrogenase (Short-subunit alcohol dehydrogenase family) n=1 Tax=Agromyces flavus TaxID=589382 RepID=A0A1H2A3P0_9MICO|nr:SDR family oxidoreductase [Agromyces flavus]MCP2367416.1 NAD(P)-dependent dehydrogenase (short-subunit alcohol dehydrogenase family) [Agromyces flavus]GGI45774.1 oxidoreductase [Agromyces flavus]SDT40575.1 NAD(P)-dependent dehydrogenase, short-chain alcohol dehydrogenase family [Agromyces flavus]
MTTNPSAPRGAALVTGAGGALGRAIALRLGADGFAIGVLGRESDFLRETASLLQAQSIPHRVLPVDLRDGTSIDSALTEVESELAPLAAVVNNAAIYPATPFLDITQDEYEDVVRVNQTAYFLTAQGAARRMVDRGAGAIVNIGSITFHGGWANLASYVSTKGASVGLTRALARELGPSGIRVNGVSPGAFPTKAEEIHENPAEYNRFVIDRQSIKRRGTDAELAAVVSFLVGPDSAFLTGQTINVDGGWIME